MKICLAALLCLATAAPALAEVAVVDAVTKLYGGKRTRVEIKLATSPIYQPQDGPIVVTLRAHTDPKEPWTDLQTWTFKHFDEGPQALLLFKSPKLSELATAKKFECQLTIEAPHAERVETNTRLEKLDY